MVDQRCPSLMRAHRQTLLPASKDWGTGPLTRLKRTNSGTKAESYGAIAKAR